MYNRVKNEKAGDENSPNGTKAETTDLSPVPISGNYGSMSLQDEPAPQFYVPWCGLVFYVIAFFGLASAEVLHSGLSVSIVAMVNHTAVADEDIMMSNVTEDQCPRDPELQREGGEFNWNRNQQGTVLAAYFYGHALTQVLSLQCFIHNNMRDSLTIEGIVRFYSASA